MSQSSQAVLPINDISTLVLEQLRLEAALPVSSGITRFAHAPSPPASLYATVSTSPPTVLTSPSTLETCYNVWLALPIPDSSQLSHIRQSLPKFSANTSSATSTLSICVTYASQLLYLPIWVLNVWPRLQSIISHSRAWERARDMLWGLTTSAHPDRPVAEEILDYFSVITIDSPFDSLAPFYTSHLPTLLMDEWLSDDHINAAVQLINSSPQRQPHIYSVDSYFVLSLQQNFERSTVWAPRRPLELDTLVLNGIVSQLLIPVHRPSHWTLLHVDISRSCYSYADTLQISSNYAPPECIRSLDRWLSSLFHTNVTLYSSPCPFSLGQQLDSHSCGVAVISTMASHAIGHPFLPWSQGTAKSHRLNWGLQFLSFTLEENMHEPLPESIRALTPTTDLSTDNRCSPSPARPNATLSPPEFGQAPQNPEKVLALQHKAWASTSSTKTVEKLSMGNRKPIQTKLSFKPIPLEQWRAQEAVRYQDRRVVNQDRLERLKIEQAQLRIERRRYERDRKRAQRERQRHSLAILVAKASARELQHESASVAMPNFPVCMRSSLAAISRDRSCSNKGATQEEQEQSHGIQGSVDHPAKSHRVNWCHPLIWPLIERTSLEVGWPWSPTEIVRRLRLKNPDVYATLRPQRISQWRDLGTSDCLKWTDAHLQAIAAGSRRALEATGGRKGIFHNHPDVVQSITLCLSDLRKAGIPLNLGIIRGYMVGVIQHYIPDAFTRTDRSGRVFRCSDQFTRRFLRDQLQWSIRKATRAAQKYPANVNTVLLHTFLRFACVVQDENVPSCCIVNADQTQVVYNPGDRKTWNRIGERQINYLGAEDKRAFTVLVGASNSGDILPPQAVYTGKSARSTPAETAPGFLEAQELGFLLEFSNTSTYWSTHKTMYNWVEKVVAPYFISQFARHKLPPSQRCILQIDCWSVHRSLKFRTWMAEKYPWIILLFVPGGCTGLFQACDVGLQRVFKLAVSKSAHADVVIETVNALRSGTPPEQIRNDQSLPTLRDRSLGWILQGFHAINRPDLVRQAFALCKVPETEFNLSYESLTSHAARQAILELRESNPDLYAEITSGHHPPSQPTAEDDAKPEAELETENEDMDHTVEDICATTLHACTAIEASEPLEPTPEYEEDTEEAPDAVLPPPTRSGRVPRPSLRYSGPVWRRH